MRRGLLAVFVVLALEGIGPITAAAQTLKLSATLTIEKSDDKTKTHEEVVALLGLAKEKKMGGNVVRYLDNMVQQLQKVLDTAKIVEQKKLEEVPKDFTPAKYRVKAMPKLQAKKITVKKMSAKDLREKLKQGKALDIKEPMLVTNATALFEDGTWDQVKRHWAAGRLMGDEVLEQKLRLEYWPPDKARARLVGNMLHYEEPDMVAFSRYMVICFHGTPAKPKLPGQNTEHCEQTVQAPTMVHNSSELDTLNIMPELKNALPLQAEFRRRLLDAAADELPKILGGKKTADRWMKRSGNIAYQYFVFGPSGSGDKLHAENGLPFYDILIHGSKRWLLMKEDEMNRVAEKAREALEFDKTSAYMFFEEKLPELKEEFGLKKYQEANQAAGDLIVVPSGWYRVSLSLADSISYYQTLLSDKSILQAVTDNNVWRPQFRQYQLAFCYEKKDLEKLPDVQKDSQLHNWLKNAIQQVKDDEQIQGILNVMLQCGSTLALDQAMPKLGVRGIASCSPAVWTQCRSRLQAKLEEKEIKVKLDWLPKQAPSSVNDIASKRDEL